MLDYDLATSRSTPHDTVSIDDVQALRAGEFRGTMMKSLVFVAFALIAAPVSAEGQQTPATAKPAAAPQNPDDRVICERVEETGTRLGSKRICMTARQWAEQRRIDRETIEAGQREGSLPSR